MLFGVSTPLITVHAVLTPIYVLVYNFPCVCTMFLSPAIKVHFISSFSGSLALQSRMPQNIPDLVAFVIRFL